MIVATAIMFAISKSNVNPRKDINVSIPFIAKDNPDKRTKIVTDDVHAAKIGIAWFLIE